MDENDDYIKFPEVSTTPVITPASSTKKEKGKARKFKLRSAPIEDLTELDIVNYIRIYPYYFSSIGLCRRYLNSRKQLASKGPGCPQLEKGNLNYLWLECSFYYSN